MSWPAKEFTFKEFPKIPRFSRDIIITEKIDGTNASITISDDASPFVESGPDSDGVVKEVPFLCGSRTRYIFPESDNAGFARWAYGNAEEILKLGPGTHFGEWWGAGIQRAYGLKNGDKRFSLFNTTRWEGKELPKGVGTVPVLYRGMFSEEAIIRALEVLKTTGSMAAPGFMKPEGVVIYHIAGNLLFKKTLEGDEKPKGSREVS